MTSLLGLLTGAAGDAPAPRDTFLYYTAHGDLAGIRRDNQKLLFAGPEAERGPLLFDVAVDINGEWNLTGRAPDSVAALEQLSRDLDAEITAHARPVRRVKETLWTRPRDDSP